MYGLPVAHKSVKIWLKNQCLYTPDIESDFAILKKTACPAVLTENGFQDCEESLQFLESNEGKEAIIGLHVDGILDFISPNREYGYKDLTKHRR